jgi:hypothetical protein
MEPMEPVKVTTVSPSSSSHLPLTLPDEIWATLSPASREAHVSAQKVLDVFPPSGRLSLIDAAQTAELSLEELAGAVHVLGNKSLVSIEQGDSGPFLRLIAVPDEHVKVTGPDGRPRWIFVARPLDPPDRDLSELN